VDVLRLVGQEHLTAAGDLHELDTLAAHRLLEHPPEPTGARVLEGHITLIGDHRPELGLNGHRLEAHLQQLRVLERERVLRLGLIELPEGRLHGAQA
jgi:hypothetical protein